MRHVALVMIIALGAFGCIEPPESTAQARKPPAAEPVSLDWEYRESSDPMSGAIERFASLRSTNEFSFKSPYANPQRGRLLIRESARRGLNILISIERGQFICGVSECTVLVRFDEAPPKRYGAVGPSDNSSTTLFIRNEQPFLKSLKAAKRVRIETVVYQEGSVMMEFNVTGLVWGPKPPPPKPAGEK